MNDSLVIIPQAADYIRVLPEIVLSLFGMAIMVLDPLLKERRRQSILGTIALFGSLAALAATWFQAQYPGFAFWNMIQVDAFSIFFHFVIVAVTAVVILTSQEYMEVEEIRAGEYYGLILFGAVGMSLMSSAVELVLIFIALEISSIATYILAGFRRGTAISSEASLKYFLLGSFATAFFLYGVALMFGATGSTSIQVIGLALSAFEVPALAYAGIALMFVGLAFKVAAAPFHIWTPDVYEGAPVPVVGFMSTAPKAAVFAVLLRLMFEAHAPGRIGLIWVVAALSMTLGNLGALVQDNVKRLLAYSSIAHAGYLLVAFRRPRQWYSRRHVLYRFLCRHECGGVCGGQPFLECGRALRQARGLLGIGQPLSGVGRYSDHLSALPDRNPHHRGFHRQILCLQRGLAVEPGRAGHPRRPEQCGRRLLLPALDRRNVHARTARRSSGFFGSARSGSGAGGQLGRYHLPWSPSWSCARLRRTGRGRVAALSSPCGIGNDHPSRPPRPLTPHYSTDTAMSM